MVLIDNNFIFLKDGPANHADITQNDKVEINHDDILQSVMSTPEILVKSIRTLILDKIVKRDLLQYINTKTENPSENLLFSTNIPFVALTKNHQHMFISAQSLIYKITFDSHHIEEINVSTRSEPYRQIFLSNDQKALISLRSGSSDHHPISFIEILDWEMNEIIMQIPSKTPILKLHITGDDQYLIGLLKNRSVAFWKIRDRPNNLIHEENIVTINMMSVTGEIERIETSNHCIVEDLKAAYLKGKKIKKIEFMFQNEILDDFEKLYYYELKTDDTIQILYQ